MGSQKEPELVIGQHCLHCADQNGRHPDSYRMIRAGQRGVWICPSCESICPMSQEEIDVITIKDIQLVGQQ